MALLLDEVFVYSELSHLHGGHFFVEAGRVELEVLVEALILFAVDVVSAGDDDIGGDQEGSAIEGYISAGVVELEEADAVVGIGHDVHFSGGVLAYFFVQQISFGGFF